MDTSYLFEGHTCIAQIQTLLKLEYIKHNCCPLIWQLITYRIEVKLKLKAKAKPWSFN
jgi:hypothetical protein